MSLIYPGGDAQVTPNLGLATWGMDEVLAENMILIDTAIGSGSTVEVNGVPVANPDFNDTTPAAPVGHTNVTWQVDGSGNVSAYISEAGLGTVTSVAMTGDGTVFNSVVPGSPITSAGTLSPSLHTQAANRLLAGPTTGPDAAPTFRALVSGDIPALAYVTSVGLTMPSIFSVAGSPVTSSGTLAVTLATETANTVWAGPTTGSAATPTFRALVAGDLPAGTGTVTSVAMTGDGVVFNSAVSGSPVTTSGTLAPSLHTQASNLVLAGPTTGSAAAPTFRALVTADMPAGTGTVTSVALTMPSIFSVAGTPVTTSGTLAVTLATETANTIWAGPTSGGAATPTFRALVSADIPTGTVTWDQIGSAATNLSLSNGTFTTTFAQTSSAAWDWRNTTPVIAPALNLTSAANASGGSTVYQGTITGFGSGLGFVGASVTIAGFVNAANNGTFTVSAATGSSITVNNAAGVSETHAGTVVSSVVTNSPILTLRATYAGASNVAAFDTWTIQDITGSVIANPTSTLTIAHSGSTGIAAVSVPVLKVTGAGTTSNAALQFTTAGVNWGFITDGSSRVAAIANGATVFTLFGTGLSLPLPIIAYKGINTVSNGVPSELAVSDLTAQSAAITATTIYAATATGMFRVSWSADITTAATTSSVLGGTNGFQVLYTSPTDSVVKTTVAGASITSAANTTGTATTGSIIVYAKTGTNIQFTYDYASVGGTVMVYELHIKVEAL